jgi:hypothetical protein
MTPPTLLHGPYRAPALRRGDRATCLYRDAEVVVTSWTGAQITWPRCRLVGGQGGSGLLVDEELARAVRRESSLAIQHWWGVSQRTVWCWRQALGVERFNEGSRRLHAQLSRTGADRLRGKALPPEQVERRRRTARELGLRLSPPHIRFEDGDAGGALLQVLSAGTLILGALLHGAVSVDAAQDEHLEVEEGRVGAGLFEALVGDLGLVAALLVRVGHG